MIDATIQGIFDCSDGTFSWMDFLDEYEAKRAIYFVSSDNNAGVHSSVKSALYDDMTGYIDELQFEENLADDEMYVVTYFEYEPCGLIQNVDFGITKQEIIENVKAQKYVEGAEYFTIGQMFYTTKQVMEGKL